MKLTTTEAHVANIFTKGLRPLKFVKFK